MYHVFYKFKFINYYTFHQCNKLTSPETVGVPRYTSNSLSPLDNLRFLYM